MRRLLKTIDEGLYRAERWVCLALLAVMSLAVFLDAVHRQASGEGRLEQLFSRALSGEGAKVASTAALAAIAWLLVYAALRTARMEKRPSARTSAAIAAIAVAVLWGLVKLLVAAFPNGLIWAQPLGLSGMLWVGFIGASMATKEGNHLSLEIMEFVWRGRARDRIGRAGAVAAASFCLLLGWLSLRQVLIEHEEWASTEGAVGMLSGFEVPRFAVFAILPWAFLVMALRFLGRALGPEEKAEGAPPIAPVVPVPAPSPSPEEAPR